ncbi:hypothetical protein CEXT_640991 [Caerostris extrusa]|uniref:Uncharacterized protein n=1 Tax=Caerostris extrusa TaxID=172846 RepID=A0AAV4MUT9_CAEEX|nr:hypothetical protein CEXT_640991 [Caerostris extrusa]
MQLSLREKVAILMYYFAQKPSIAPSSLKHSSLSPDPSSYYLVQTRCFRPIQKQNKWPLSVCLGRIISTTALSLPVSDSETALFCVRRPRPLNPPESHRDALLSKLTTDISDNGN